LGDGVCSTRVSDYLTGTILRPFSFTRGGETGSSRRAVSCPGRVRRALAEIPVTSVRARRGYSLRRRSVRALPAFAGATLARRQFAPARARWRVAAAWRCRRRLVGRWVRRMPSLLRRRPRRWARQDISGDVSVALMPWGRTGSPAEALMAYAHHLSTMHILLESNPRSDVRSGRGATESGALRAQRGVPTDVVTLVRACEPCARYLRPSGAASRSSMPGAAFRCCLVVNAVGANVATGVPEWRRGATVTAEWPRPRQRRSIQPELAWPCPTTRALRQSRPGHGDPSPALALRANAAADVAPAQVVTLAGVGVGGVVACTNGPVGGDDFAAGAADDGAVPTAAGDFRFQSGVALPESALGGWLHGERLSCSGGAAAMGDGGRDFAGGAPASAVVPSAFFRGRADESGRSRGAVLKSRAARSSARKELAGCSRRPSPPPVPSPRSALAGSIGACSGALRAVAGGGYEGCESSAAASAASERQRAAHRREKISDGASTPTALASFRGIRAAAVVSSLAVATATRQEMTDVDEAWRVAARRRRSDSTAERVPRAEEPIRPTQRLLAGRSVVGTKPARSVFLKLAQSAPLSDDEADEVPASTSARVDRTSDGSALIHARCCGLAECDPGAVRELPGSGAAAALRLHRAGEGDHRWVRATTPASTGFWS